MSEISLVLEKIASALESNSKKFEELDAVAGDGDLGIAVGKIAAGMRSGIYGLTGDLKVDLMFVGREIASAAPSTFGTLIATGFIRASAVVSAQADGLTNARKCLSAACEGMAARGKAQLGERTLLDALYPAVEAFQSEQDFQAGLMAAALASRSGATATALMTPKHGRAGWIGERAKGFEDAGATVIAVAFESLI